MNQSMNDNVQNTKLKNAVRGSGSAMSKYFDVTYGPMARWKAILMEIVTLLFSGIPGALGLFLRSYLYRPFFAECSGKVIIGRHVTLRHSCKICLGDGVILDDNCVVDAKGVGNKGIALGDNVYVGRNSIVYCKGGNITLGNNVNISANCIIFSSNDLEMKQGSMVGAYCYLLSGGEYDYKSELPFAQQTGMGTKGPLTIGENCWFGARVTVLDGASIGNNCVIGANAVVTRPVPSDSIAVGVPAVARPKL